MLEDNGLVLGRIPANGGGICKTYPESKLGFIGDKSLLESGEQFYLNKNTNEVSARRYIRDFGEKYKELVILSILPYGGVDQYGRLIYEFIVEFIEKDVLYKHLIDERSIIAEQLRNSSSDLSL